MASGNPFDILGGDDNDDPSLLIAAQQKKLAASKPAVAPVKEAAKFPSKPAPPAQAVREARSGSGNAARGGGVVGGGRNGTGRGRGGFGGGSRDYGNENASAFSGGYGFGGGGEDGETRKPFERGPRQPYRGGRRGGYVNGEVGGTGGDSEQPARRVYERRSGTGRGNELKREGSGRGNWGTMSDDVIAMENPDVQTGEDKVAFTEKKPDEERPAYKDNKDDESKDKEEKEEDKEMTLEEYEKILEDKRKALLAMKAEERKVVADKEFGSMKQLCNKKENDDIFIQLGSSKEARKVKDNDKDDKVKKPVSINDFLKPADGGRYYGSSGRGRGRGRGGRGPYMSDEGSPKVIPEAVIKIEDPGHFPTLGGK